MMNKWKTVKENQVRCEFKCPVCRELSYVCPVELVSDGRVYCINCEQELDYQKTQVAVE